ncbi:GNAT family N-acetyltransferase [Amycolatopsis ultiminotia]|uniref:GNAT family N-acetyltransferase n=2 Tax=Amycolatopsis ultiminotia TaxID=543629 RepID=A0ABP6V3D7_9PSEU
MADLDLLHTLMRVAGEVDHPREVYSRELVERGLTGERFDLSADAVIALSDGGEAVAYGEAKPADAETGVFLDGVVHPGWRGHGIGRALLSWQEARARQLLAASGSDRPARIAVGAREENEDALSLFRATGFQPVRWWLELWRSLDEPIPEPGRALPEGVSLRAYSAELSEPTRLAMNDAFRGHWGSQPTTAQEWEEEHALEAFAPHLSRLAVTGAGTAEEPHVVVGAVLIDVDEVDWELNGGPFAYLAMIGVVHAWRGKGLSSALLLSALRACRDAGMLNAALDVDAANPSGAVEMYSKLGFAERERSVTYAKHI